MDQVYVIAGGGSARRGPSGRRITKHDRAPFVGGRAAGRLPPAVLPAPPGVSLPSARPRRCSAGPYGSPGRLLAAAPFGVPRVFTALPDDARFTSSFRRRPFHARR